MVNLLTDEVKNTKLILTLCVLGMVTFFGAAIFALAFMARDLPDFYQGAITTILGFLIGLVTQAFLSYFKADEVIQAAKIDAVKQEGVIAKIQAEEKLEAAKVP